MDVNTNLDGNATMAINSAIGQLQHLSSTLAGDEERAVTAVRDAFDHPHLASAVRGQLGTYRSGMASSLEAASRHLEAREFEPALQALLSAHAMTMAQLTSLDILAESQAQWSLATSATASSPAVTPTSQSPSAAPAASPPPSLQSLFNKLGKIGAWLWGIIQTLLTPKGWSIEGGISFPGLASAKLTVAFGK
jgi:hypothetical protein